MKKKVFLIAILIILNLVTKSQSCYYDALKLREFIILKGGKPKFIIKNASIGDTVEQKKTMKEYCDLLNTKYYQGALVSTIDIHSSLGDATDSNYNPFLAAFLTASGGLSIDGIVINKSKSFGSILSSLGGIEIPNNILLGVTDFIVKRTKQELSIAFFEKFKETIEKPGYIDLRTVFPQTHKTLLAIGDEIYKYNAYLQMLREAFINDIDVLDENLPTIIDNHPGFWNKHKEWKATLQSAFYITSSLKDKVHPGDILQDYPSYFLDPLNKNWKASIQTLQLFSSSLRDTASNKDSANYWVSPSQIKKLITDETTFRIYLGLVYQKAKIDFPDSITFQKRNGVEVTLLSLLRSLADSFSFKYKSYATYISQFSEKTNKLNTLIKNHQKESNDSIAFQQYYNYFNATINLMQQATEISKLPYIKDVVPNLADTLKDYFDIARTTGNLVMDIKRRSYSSAVTNAAHIYELVKARQARVDRDSVNIISLGVANFKQLRTDIVKGINNSNDLLSLQSKLRVDSARLAITTMSISPITLSKENLDSITDTKKQLLKYGAFLALVATAKSSKDVENVINSVALPAGSARIKRESKWNVSLNAYCGLYTGWEKIKGVDSGGFKLNSFGVTVPIGFAISKGGWGKGADLKKGGKSISAFISLVDLGAVAAFRFTNDSAEKVPSVQLKDIVSPGIFLSFGLGKLPLSLNLGYQMGPLLRKVNLDKNKYENKYGRLIVSVCVDLPLLNLFNR